MPKAKLTKKKRVTFQLYDTITDNVISNWLDTRKTPDTKMMKEALISFILSEKQQSLNVFISDIVNELTIKED